MEDTKVNRNRLRIVAKRQGYRLTKSARRDPRALDYGRYWLTDQTGEIVAGGRNGVDLETVARVLGDQA